MIKLRKPKSLGVADAPRRYDLPLSRDDGSTFLILLTALMTYLAALALTSALALNGAAHRWSSGLENQITIEIPAEAAGGVVRSPEEIRALTDKAAAALQGLAPVESFHALSRSEVFELVEPWLGESALTDSLPLPGMIAATLKNNTEGGAQILEGALKSVSPDITADANQQWLADALNLIRAAQAGAALVVALVAVTTALAIGGAIRSRMAALTRDIELLHLMGASDSYIMKQFQRHSVILALTGGMAGTLAALITLGLFYYAIPGSAEETTPVPPFGFFSGAFLVLTPAATCLIAAAAARFAVLGKLKKMI